MNDIHKAIDYYKKSDSISRSRTISFAIAACYLKLKDFINYEKYLKEAATGISSDGEVFKAYGQLLELSKSDYQNAIKYYKLATLSQNSPEPYILLATTYLKLREIDNALKTIKHGLYGFPENPTLLYLHSTVLINRGDSEPGIKELIKVINNISTPTDIRIESCNILVNIFLKQNDLQKAKKYNDLALNINPKNQEALRNKPILNMGI
jgi:tetratricopeptide (TPR) repeat protein